MCLVWFSHQTVVFFILCMWLASHYAGDAIKSPWRNWVSLHDDVLSPCLNFIMLNFNFSSVYNKVICSPNAPKFHSLCRNKHRLYMYEVKLVYIQLHKQKRYKWKNKRVDGIRSPYVRTSHDSNNEWRRRELVFSFSSSVWCSAKRCCNS